MIDLIQGDCLEVMQTIESGSIDAIITDPPYGTTACKWDSVIDFELMWKQLNRIIKDNGAIVLFGSEPFSSALRMSNIKNYRYDWIWEKNRATGHLNAKKRPMVIHEQIHIFYKKQSSYNAQKEQGKPYQRLNCSKDSTNKGVYGKMNVANDTINTGDRFPKSIIKFKRVERTQHPTQKPIALMEYLIRTYTNENETVLDFTMGSGSTMVACQNTNRNGIGIEQDEKYFKIAEQRIKENEYKLF